MYGKPRKNTQVLKRADCMFSVRNSNETRNMFVTSSIEINWPLEGNRADPGKILSRFPSLKSGDHVPPPTISSWEVLVVVFVVLVLVLVVLGVVFLVLVAVVACHYFYYH